MAEPRIIHPVPMGPAGPNKKLERVPKTLRFDLTLKESTNDSCSEFSWLELVKKAADNDEEKLKEALDPFALQDLEEQRKLEEIAKSFESRYAPKPGKKKRKVHIQDFIDRGDGYDETDPFVDNSEAYDELVPATLTTKLGGFYINTGVLDFREVAAGESDGEFQSPKKKKKKLRVITSDSDSAVSAASSVSSKKKKLALHMKKKRVDGEILKKKRKKLQLSSGDEKQLVKKSKMIKDKETSAKKNVPNVAELIKQQATPPEKKAVTVNGESATPVTTGAGKGSDSIFSTIDAVISQSLTESPDSEGRTTPTPNPENAPSLPPGIPESLVEIIKSIKESARQSVLGKCKFFNSSVNRMLLVIEKESRQLTCSQRSGIYLHLAAFLPCSKETLLKRAKKLRLNEQDNKVRDPINKLKETVNRVMPAYIEQYTQECKAAAMAKTGEKVEGKNEGGSSDSDDENRDDNKKKAQGPRKRFTWTTELRELLCDVISVKMMSYEMSKMRTQSAEEYLKTFLDTEIKPIWPKGWMQTRMLYKEGRMAHAQWTANAQKPKKNMIITGRITTSASNSPTPTTNTSVNSTCGTPKQPSKAQKTVDNGLNNLMTLLDYAEEHDGGTKLEENDTADVLSSFLDSEAASEMLMSMSDNHVPLADIEEKIPIRSAAPKQTKTFSASNMVGSESFMAQFQKFTGTYKEPEEVSKSQPSVKSEHKKLTQPLGHPSQSRDLKTEDRPSSNKPTVSTGQTNLCHSMTASRIGALDFEQLSPPRSHYQTVQNPKSLQRSLSADMNSIPNKNQPLNASLGIGGSSPKLSIHGASVRNTGASSSRHQNIEAVRQSVTNPIGAFPTSPLSDVSKESLATMYAAQAMASLASMNHAVLSSHALQQQKSLQMDFKPPHNTADYSGKAEALHQDSMALLKQHRQFLQQGTSLAPSAVHLNSSTSSSHTKSTSPAVWGSTKSSQSAHGTASSRPGYNIPLSRISPTSSISTGMPAGYKSISLLDQQKESSLLHQGLQISRATSDSMRGAGSSGYTHHSPGNSNHSPLGHGPLSPHGHSPKGLYPSLAHSTSPRHPMPNSPFAGQYPTDKSRSPHGY